MLVDDHHDREATGNAGRRPAPGSEMKLTAWGDSPAVAYDRQLWAELASLWFLVDETNALTMVRLVAEKHSRPTH
jgi:hypothetical protein